MDFIYVIKFWTQDGRYREIGGFGQFHPSDDKFKIEHGLWLCTELWGRPRRIELTMHFEGDENGPNTSKCLEAPQR